MELQGSTLNLSFDEAICAYFGAVKRQDQELAIVLSDLLNQSALANVEASHAALSLEDTAMEDDPIGEQLQRFSDCADVCLDCDLELEHRVVRAIRSGTKTIKEFSDAFDEGLLPRGTDSEHTGQTSVRRGHLTFILGQ